MVVCFANGDFVFDMNHGNIPPSHFDVVIDDIDAVDAEIALHCQMDSDVGDATAGVEGLRAEVVITMYPLPSYRRPSASKTGTGVTGLRMLANELRSLTKSTDSIWSHFNSATNKGFQNSLWRNACPRRGMEDVTLS